MKQKEEESKNEGGRKFLKLKRVVTAIQAI